MHLIIDSDPIVYRCGFAAETPTYHLVAESEETGEIEELVFAPYDGKTAGARMQRWMQDHPDWNIIEKEKRIYPEPESHALEAVRTQLYSIERECREHYNCEFTGITTILSGPGNYREKLATQFPYKGNRDPAHKPHWYQSIRNFLTRDYGARVVHGREADDECSILARGSPAPCVIATIDKDLDQIAGHHYNYLKQVFYAQSEHDAVAFFLKQCLSGDSTDGIPGCYKIGEQRAAAIVDNELANMGRATTPRGGTTSSSAATAWRVAVAHVWPAIVQTYRDSTRKAGCTYVEGRAEAVALETARLVYLQHKEGELWIPSGPPHDLLEDYRDE